MAIVTFSSIRQEIAGVSRTKRRRLGNLRKLRFGYCKVTFYREHPVVTVFNGREVAMTKTRKLTPIAGLTTDRNTIIIISRIYKYPFTGLFTFMKIVLLENEFLKIFVTRFNVCKDADDNRPRWILLLLLTLLLLLLQLLQMKQLLQMQLLR